MGRSAPSIDSCLELPMHGMHRMAATSESSAREPFPVRNGVSACSRSTGWDQPQKRSQQAVRSSLDRSVPHFFAAVRRNFALVA